MTLKQLGDRLLAKRIGSREFLSRAETELQKLYLYAFDKVWGRSPTDSEIFEVIEAVQTQLQTNYDLKTDRYWGLTMQVKALAAGNISPAEFTASLDRYAASAQPFYWKQAVNKAKSQGKVYAIRRLGAAEHCAQCPGHERLTPTLIDLITPPGADCDCRGNCKCELEFV